MLFSILIATLETRRVLFDGLYRRLQDQITENALTGTVEVMFLRDNGELPVGLKRNRLVARARGAFIAFVDDDDDVSDDYVPSICRVIQENPDIDCIGMKGVVTFGGKKPRVFIHSLQYEDYASRGGVYMRPPYHLNPIRREIALRYPFEEIDYSEDVDWAMRISRDHALKREVLMDHILYYYRSRRSWAYQWVLDCTEGFRHACGLRWSNRIRWKRWIRSGGRLNTARMKGPPGFRNEALGRPIEETGHDDNRLFHPSGKRSDR